MAAAPDTQTPDVSQFLLIFSPNIILELTAFFFDILLILFCLVVLPSCVIVVATNGADASVYKWKRELLK